MWEENFMTVFTTFLPRGSECLFWARYFWTKSLATWFRVLTEDRWVEEKFGELDPTQEDNPGRTILCQFFNGRQMPDVKPFGFQLRITVLLNRSSLLLTCGL